MASTVASRNREATASARLLFDRAAEAQAVSAGLPAPLEGGSGDACSMSGRLGVGS